MLKYDEWENGEDYITCGMVICMLILKICFFFSIFKLILLKKYINQNYYLGTSYIHFKLLFDH